MELTSWTANTSTTTTITKIAAFFDCQSLLPIAIEEVEHIVETMFKNLDINTGTLSHYAEGAKRAASERQRMQRRRAYLVLVILQANTTIHVISGL